MEDMLNIMVVNDNKLWEKWDNDKKTTGGDKKKIENIRKLLTNIWSNSRSLWSSCMLQVDVGQWGAMRNGESKQGMTNLVMEE
jgi:ABC-type histidine transport system ATPase subunit